MMSNVECISYLTDIVLKDSVNQDASNIDDVADTDSNKKGGKGGSSSGSDSSNGSNNGCSKSSSNGKKGKKVEEVERTTSQAAAESLIDLAFNEGSTDNISAVVIQFY